MARRIPVRPYRYWLGGLVPAVLAAGFVTPYAGFVVPVVMLAALGTAALGGGRRFCGRYCPRGSFLEAWLGRLRRRPLPAAFRGPLRWAVMVALLAFMVWRLAENPADPAHWGRVFWVMCLATTAVALALAAVYRPRAWCVVCPVGSMSTLLRRPRHRIDVPEGCRGCKLCDKACSVGLAPSRGIRGTAAADCLQCAACTEACPLLPEGGRLAA